MNKMLKCMLLALMACIMMSCSTRINAGYEGIKVNLYGDNKGVDDISMVTGRVWYNPITTEVYEYPVFVQTVDYNPFTINAKDGSEFTVDPTISLKIVDGTSPEIFRKYRKDVEEVIKNAPNEDVKKFYARLNESQKLGLFKNTQSPDIQLSMLKHGIVKYEEVVPQKLHLHACILRIHGLDIEPFGPDDLHFLVFVEILLQIGGLEAAAGLMLCNQFIFIFLQLSFNDLLHQVDGNIHVVACLLRADDTALHRDRHFNLLPFLLHAQGHDHFRIRGEVFFQFAQFVLNSAAQPRGYIDVLSADHNLHTIIIPSGPNSEMPVPGFPVGFPE